MALSLLHSKVSSKSDAADNSLVRASDWNAEHAITMSQGVIGNADVTDGPAEVIPFSSLQDLITATNYVINVREPPYNALGDSSFTSGSDVSDCYVITAGQDDTSAIQAALDFGAGFTPPRSVYIPAGNYYITDQLTVVEGQAIFGDGSRETSLVFKATSSLTHDGFIKADGPYVEIRDLGFIFEQVATATRITATHYPAAIRVSRSHCLVENVFIAGAYIGIDGSWNSSTNDQGSALRLHGCDVGALHTGIAHNHSFDHSFFINLFLKPYGLGQGGTTLGDAYRDGTTFGVDLATEIHETIDSTYHMDGMQFVNIFCQKNNIRIGRSSGQMTNGMFDGEGSGKFHLTQFVSLSSGGWHFNNITKISSATGNGDYFFKIESGEVTINNFWYKGDALQTVPVFDITDAHVVVSNGVLRSLGQDFATFYLNPTTDNGGSLKLNNIRVDQGTGLAFTTHSLVEQVKGRLHMNNCRFAPVGAGTGPILKITTNLAHVITDNDFGGWVVSLPATSTNGLYWPNGSMTGTGWTAKAFLNAPEFDLYDTSNNHYYMGYNANEVYFGSNADRFVNFYSADVLQGRFYEKSLQLVDGVTAPATTAGFAKIYVDTADGDLKVKFGDGTIKTIVVDT